MDYLKVFLVLAPQLIAGCLIYLLILKRDEVALVELLSIGGVFGIVTSTIFDQIFVNLQLPRIGWLVPLLIALVVFRIMQKNQTIVLPRIQTEQAFKKTILPILAISAAALGTEWFWLFPSGVLFCFAAFLSIAPEQTYSRIAIRLTNLAALIAGVVMIVNRPKIWWFLYDSDYAFLQGLSRSLADWGLNDYFLLSGIQTKYHWFTYAWIGLVDRSSTAATFFVLTRIAPVVFVILITGIIWSLINRYSITRLRTFTSTLVVMTASSYAIWGGGTKITFLASPSQFYAFAILLTAVHLLLATSNDQIKFPVVVLTVLSGATILSKTMHGVVLISAILFVVFIQLFVKPRISRTIAISSLFCVAGSLLTYWIFVSNSEAQAVFEFRFSDFFWQLQGDARLLPDKYIDIIGLLTVISFLALPLLLAIRAALQLKHNYFGLKDLLGLGSLIAGTCLALSILGAFGENLYFLHAAIVMSSVIGFASFSEVKSGLSLRPRGWLIFIFAGVVLCLASYQIPNINSGSQSAIIIRSMRIYTPTLILLISAAGVLLVNSLRRRPSVGALSKLIVIAVSMSVTFAATNWLETIPRKHNEFSRDGDSYLASFNLDLTAKWVNENTNETEIVASNFGWPKIAEGEFESYRSPCLAVRNKDVAVETCKRTNNALLVAYMHRRTWLQATSVHYTGFTPEMDKRQTATLGFAVEPNAEHLQQMESDGVTWYVVDRSTTDRTDWEPFATVRYTNDSFYVLELNTTG